MIGLLRAGGRPPTFSTASAKSEPSAISFDDLVGAQQGCCRQCDAERLRGFQIEDELKAFRLFNRKISGFRAAQNLCHKEAPRRASQAKSIP